MAIYHFTADIVSRAKGQSVVAAAAYRSGTRMREDTTGILYDYTRKIGVEHTEILAPDPAPSWVSDRAQLWNTIEALEKRKDAQLARSIEIALPKELNEAAQLTLVREFVRREFVSKGMVADVAIHRDNANNPHVHILLTLRRLGPKGFGLKERAWNQTARLQEWRLAWAETTNRHLAKEGLSIRIDHRTLKAQGLDLIPGRKIGVSRERQQSNTLPPKIAERVAEQRSIASENGARILADPNVAVKGLTHYQATFTEHDIARFLNTRTDGAEQFRDAYLKVTTSPELVLLGTDDRGKKRYTSREMLEIESEMLHRAEWMSLRNSQRLAEHRMSDPSTWVGLNGEQGRALNHLVAGGDLKCIVGIAGSGKSRLLNSAREIWEVEGYSVKGTALSGIAAENLTVSSGIPARTLASYELAWKGGRDLLTQNDVLVIDEAGMVGTRQLARVLEAAETAGAKIILVGDPEQLQSIEAGAAFRGIAAEVGVAELTEVHRQTAPWQKVATRQLAQGETPEALATYEREGSIIQTTTRDRARSELIDQWSLDAQQNPHQTRLILAYTRKDVHELNELARCVRRERHELGHAEAIETERGMREFATHDRIYFLRNERSLGVKNGTLGTITALKDGVFQVRLDNTHQQITVDTRFYRDLDHGYAATVHKAQGATVDRSYLLATAHLDRHAAYVALTRHREGASVFYAAEDFGRAGIPEGHIDREARQRFVDVLSRAAPKELAHDYLDRDNTYFHADFRELDVNRTPRKPDVPSEPSSLMDEIDAMQQRGADAWLEKQLAREKRASQHHGRELDPGSSQDPALQQKPHPRKDRGIEDDFGLP